MPAAGCGPSEAAKTFSADQVVILEEHRFEGVSDPDDMAILYGLETRGGLRGTLADAFGVYADPLVERLHGRRRAVAEEEPDEHSVDQSQHR